MGTLKDLIRRGKQRLLGQPDGGRSEQPAAKSEQEDSDSEFSCSVYVAGSSQDLEEQHQEQGSHLAHQLQEMPTWDGIWVEAYKAVKADPEHTKLLTAYTEHLKADATKPAADREDDTSFKSIQTTAERNLENIEDARLSFNFHGRRIVVREAVLRAVQAVTLFKPLINGAIYAEPHAALAWAGIMMVIPILENAFQQDKDAANGLNNILFLLIRYQRLQDEDVPAQFKCKRSKLINVYMGIYIYQIRFVLQFSRVKRHRALRNTVSADGWKKMWSDIESTSQLIDQVVRDLVGVKIFESFDIMNDLTIKMERLEYLQQDTLDAVQVGNENDLLALLPFAGNATFDSAEILGVEAPCLSGTQQDILNEIQKWAEDPNGEAIFWVHGMAGTGKTSVALTVANALHDRRSFADACEPLNTTFLGASFFFKQGDATRNSTKTFFPTLARCLAEAFPDLRTHIVGEIEASLSIGSKAPQQQLKHLIIKPISALGTRILLPIRLIVVIDALDECLDRREAKELLAMLAALEELHQVQLRLLITSRRETHIHESFEKLPKILYRACLLNKIERHSKGDAVKDDITFYLLHMLDEIADKHGVQRDWISQGDIQRLTDKSDGLFMHAATACRFLDAEDFFDREARQERLDQIFQDEGNMETPQQKIDEIYTKVLSLPIFFRSGPQTRQRMYDRVGKLLGVIVVLFEPLCIQSVQTLLASEEKPVGDLLKLLHSILNVPPDKHLPISLVHLSFRDFILDTDRSKQLRFQINEDSMHRQMLERCLDIMSPSLHKDICGLVQPGILISDIPQGRINECIPEYLAYICRYWVEHLAKLDQTCRAEVGLKDHGVVHEFLQEKCLFWLEAMSLIRRTPETIVILGRLQALVNPLDHPELSAFVYDIKRFVLDNSPQKSLVRLQYQHIISSHSEGSNPSWVTQEPATREEWNPVLVALKIDDAAGCFTFSATGALLAYNYWTMQLWDHPTSTELMNLNTKSLLNTVSFSPNGRFIVSGAGPHPTRDNLLVVRELATGIEIDFEYDNACLRVAFSPTSDDIVISVSRKGVVQIWDVHARKQLSRWIVPDLLHLNRSRFMLLEAAFSSDGNFLVMVDDEGRVIQWDLKEGRLVKKFELPKGEMIASVSISMDGKTAAFALRRISADEPTFRSRDAPSYTLRLYNLETGRQQAEASYRHRRISSVALVPPYADQVALALPDIGIELFDINTCTVQGRFGIPKGSTSMALSPDGKTMAVDGPSGSVYILDVTSIPAAAVAETTQNTCNFAQFLSEDEKVVLTSSWVGTRLWNTADGSSRDIHLKNAVLAEVSPDARFVAVSSYANDSQLWDKNLNTRYLTNWGKVSSIAFSRQGNKIALAMERGGLRIINSLTLEMITKLDVDYVFNLELSPNGQVVGFYTTSAEGDNTVQIWIIGKKRNKKLLSMTCSDDHYSITFSSNGRWVAFYGQSVATKDGKPRLVLVELATGKKKVVYSEYEIEAFAFHPESHLNATGSRDGQIVVRETDSFSEKFSLQVAKPADSGMESYSFSGLVISSQGKLVALSYGPECIVVNVQMWDIMTGMEIGRYEIDGLPKQGVICFQDPRAQEHARFSSDERFLEWRSGLLPLPMSTHYQDKSVTEDEEDAAATCLWISGQWIMQGYERLVRLPLSYQTGAFATRGDTVVIGKHAGPTALIKFDLKRTPIAANMRPSRTN
ncbi:hypothetical protein FSARC_8513 [Fusarium sarcochroum]|uniref:NWD NACHT-NTPase N-terminal domain-containing protein n=1 Tax=Fusarium sarcochroum TaxID=1208366 RepID=A0A8H4TT75_9HYPO|nr:hypothetical protein FSARC_8513 [Fusarium sarcochroum]